VFLHRGHTWAAVEDSGAARVGVDSFARKAIGHIDAIELPEVGQTVRQGERLFAYRQGNRVAEFVAPIDGTVTHLNEKASSRDGQAVADWICRIKPRNLSGNLDVLTIAEDAVKWVYQELLRLQEMVAMQIPRLQTVGVTMQDGPLALDNLLESFDDETWNTFQNKFLTRHTGSLEEK
jgi:glycine cleavage system H lipoate-binding protein